MARIVSRSLAIGLLASAWLLCVAVRPAAAVVTLGVEMITDPSVIGPGGSLTFEIEVTNSGDEAALGVVIQSAVPTETSFFAASDGGIVVGGNNVEWSIGSLAGPGAETLELVVDVNFPAVSANSIVNAVLVTATNAASVSDGTLTPIQPLGVDISFTTAPPGCDGSLFRTYPVRFVNGADNAVGGVELTAEIPDGTTLNSPGLGTARCAVVPNDSCSSASDCSSGLCELFWDIGTLGSEEQSLRLFTVRVDDVEPAGTLLNSTAVITAGVDQATDSAPTSTVADTPCPVVEKSDLGAGTIEPGTIIGYRISALNAGRVAATGSELSDPLPTGTSFESATPSSCDGDPVTGEEDAGVVVWDLGVLDPEELVEVCLELLVDPNTTADSIQNTATFTDLEGDLVSGTEITVIERVTALSLTKNGKPDPVEVGEQLTYTLRFENQASFAIDDVVISDDPNDRTPSGCVSFNAAATAACGGDVPAMDSGGLITWDVGSVIPGGDAEVCDVVNVDACAGEQLRNIARASDSRGEETQAIARTRIQADRVKLRLFKQTPGQIKIQTGDDIQYRLRLQNRTDDETLNVTLTDDLAAVTPAGTVTFVGAASSECGGSGPDGVLAGNVVTWSFPALAPGEETVCLRVNTSAALAMGTRIVNSALASDPNGNTAEDSISTKLFTKPFRLRIVDLDDPVLQGDQIRYEISVDNLGEIPLGPDPNLPPGDRKDVLIKTRRPAGTSLGCVSGSTIADCATPVDGIELVRDPFRDGGGRVLWKLTEPLGTVGAEEGNSKTLEMVVTVTKKKRTIRARVRAKEFTLRSKGKARALTVVERD